MTLNSVVLPAPFGPMRPVTIPASATKSTASSASRPPKLTLTSAISSVLIAPSSGQRGFLGIRGQPEGGVELAHLVGA